ncbi:MAG TPA: ParB N-terminal domain-containing protein [Planctomycetota bacterium]|nr:ParB N-terminal domain-containing protein [Planctomycetota bacterium]
MSDTQFAPQAPSLTDERIIPWTGKPAAPAETSLSTLKLIGLVAAVLALAKLLALCTIVFFRQRGKPAVEGVMVSRIYMLIGFVIIGLTCAYGFGTLAAISAFFATFGGMLMGFSLQAPISGFAAWVLVSVMRPFRPGDRVQFPNLGLVGDVKDVGLMYTVLDQVGGSVGSEEAVGRNILIPNAMLFSQVAINYTVTQESAFMLDEVVARITFDSDWNKAEQILLNAAREITADIIKATGVQPYIRSDLYDYGVYLRLRYQTSVKDRAEIAYKIGKRIFQEIQREPNVDHAIPFLYSARAGRGILTMRAENGMSGTNGANGHSAPQEPDQDAEQIRDVEIAQIFNAQKIADIDVVEQLAQSIATHGLLQPIVVLKNPRGRYDVVAGQMRLEACRRLGWKTIPAVVKGADEIDSRLTVEHLDRSSSGK